jgi:hypothetical protein
MFFAYRRDGDRTPVDIQDLEDEADEYQDMVILSEDRELYGEQLLVGQDGVTQKVCDDDSDGLDPSGFDRVNHAKGRGAL